MTPWQWWAGEADNVESEGQYDVDFDTREEAVAWANREYPDGTAFYVVEARSSTDAKYSSGNYDLVPFIQKRHEERLVARAASAMSAGTAETQSGSGLQPASAVPEGQTPRGSHTSQEGSN